MVLINVNVGLLDNALKRFKDSSKMVIKNTALTVPRNPPTRTSNE